MSSDTEMNTEIVPAMTGEIVRQGDHATETAKARVLGEIQGQIILARQFPRSPMEATRRIIESCKRPRLAEHSMYEYSRGGSKVCGPSIRLAEVLKREWGNIRSGWREVERKPGKPGRSTVVAYAWDLETNVPAEREFLVLHQITTRSGVRFLTDERDIYELIANQAARRVRACILELIPGDVVEEAVEQCNKTLVGEGGKPMAVRIKEAVAKFEEIGVSVAEIEEFFGGRRVDRISPIELARLARIYQSIDDGVGSIEEFFRRPKRDDLSASGGDGDAPAKPKRSRAEAIKQSAKKSAKKSAAKEWSKPDLDLNEVPMDGAEAYTDGYPLSSNPWHPEKESLSWADWNKAWDAESRKVAAK